MGRSQSPSGGLPVTLAPMIFSVSSILRSRCVERRFSPKVMCPTSSNSSKFEGLRERMIEILTCVAYTLLILGLMVMPYISWSGVRQSPIVFQGKTKGPVPLFGNESEWKEVFGEWGDLMSSHRRLQIDMLEGRRPLKAVVYSCDPLDDMSHHQSGYCGGLGDRLRGMTTAYYLAALSDRAFFISAHFPSNFSSNLEANFLPWNMTPNEGTNSIRLKVPPIVRSNIDAHLHTDPIIYLDNHAERMYNHPPPHDVAFYTITCNNEYFLPHQAITAISRTASSLPSNSSGIHHFVKIPAAILHQAPQKCLLNLFKPTQLLTRHTESFLARGMRDIIRDNLSIPFPVHFRVNSTGRSNSLGSELSKIRARFRLPGSKPIKVIGIHYRVQGGFEAGSNRVEPKDFPDFLVSTESLVQTYCNVTEHDFIYVVSSDNDEVRAMAPSVIPGRVIVVPVTPFHIDKPKGDPVLGMRSVFCEFLLLSLCDVVVSGISPHHLPSGFSMGAAAFGQVQYPRLLLYDVINKTVAPDGIP